MLWWILMVFALAILSYLSTVGALFTLEVRYPFLTSTFINILILACIAGAVVRTLRKMKKGEKEILIQRVKKLEEEVKALKEKSDS